MFHSINVILLAAPSLFAMAAVLAGPRLPTCAAQELSDQERTALLDRRQKLLEEMESLAARFRRPADLSPIPQPLLESAVAKGNELLATNRKLYGDRDESIATALSWIAARYEDAEDFQNARETRKKSLDLRHTIHGPQHWKSKTAARELSHCEKLAKLTPKQREKLKFPEASFRFAVRIFGPEAALSSLNELIDQQSKLLGKDDSKYLASLYRSGLMNLEIGNFRAGIERLRSVMESELRILGDDHPDYGMTCYAIAMAYMTAGQYDLSKPLWQKAQACFRRAYGADSDKYKQWCAQLCAQLMEHATRLAEASKFATSKGMLEDNLALVIETRGENDWRVKDAKLSIEYLSVRQRLPEGDRQELARAETLERQLGDLESPGQIAAAVVAATMASKIRERLQGKQHRDYALAVLKTALLMQLNEDYTNAVPQFKIAAKTLGELLGRDSQPFVRASMGLALSYRSLALRALDAGDSSATLQHLRAVVECLRGVKRKTPELAVALNNLGLHLVITGEYALALETLHDALECHEETLGKGDAEYATTLHNLGLARSALGDWAGAERVLRQALRIREDVLGRSNPYYAQTLYSLAFTQRSNEYERYLKLALDIERNHADTSGNVGILLMNLASHYWSERDFELAEKYVLEAQEYCESRSWTPLFSNAMLEIASLIYRDKGNLELSKDYLDKSVEFIEGHLGKNHPAMAVVQTEMAKHHLLTGNPVAAASSLNTAMKVARRGLDESMYGVSERQQLSARKDLQQVLHLQLSLSATAETGAHKSYGAVFLSKGMVFQRQYLLRLARSDEALQPMFSELESVVHRLSLLALAGEGTADKESTRSEAAALSERVDELERELSQESEAFRVFSAGWTEDSCPQSRLPEGTVFVDFLEYSKTSVSDSNPKKLESTKHLVAFVLRKDTPIAMAELGPAEPIEVAVAQWRKSVGIGLAKDGTSPADELRRLVWRPLKSHLGHIDQLLISPDGVAARIPFAALPGELPGSFLIEQFPIAIVPVPRMFFNDRETTHTDDSLENQMLLVGDVDYGGPPGKTGRSRSAELKFRAGLVSQFPRLSATRVEILAIKDSFEQSFPDAPTPSMLRGAKATEGALRQHAPRCRWLHVATHGFFAPSTLRSKLGDRKMVGPMDLQAPMKHGLSTFHPGLLSGLALAGANREANAELDDGIFTALEVGSVDLRGVELTVLSACETGLGEVAGGEGQLGLQRAFQVAGSRAVVSSMWKVNDRTTQQLMSDFYENLWEKKMTKLEALRAAQISMLSEGASRGLGPPLPEDGSADKERRLPPYYWAAFVLSGDWR